MLQLIYHDQILSSTITLQSSFLNSIEQEQATKIKELAINALTKVRNFVTSFSHQSKERNLKPIAMVGCLLLIALLIISVLKRQNDSIVSPRTAQIDD